MDGSLFLHLPTKLCWPEYRRGRSHIKRAESSLMTGIFMTTLWHEFKIDSVHFKLKSGKHQSFMLQLSYFDIPGILLGPPLWSSAQSCWLQIQGARVRFPGGTRFFWEVVGLERGPLSLVRIKEELLEWKSSGSWSRKLRLTAVGIRCADHATPIRSWR
jgi:hypothetical protein